MANAATFGLHGRRFEFFADVGLQGASAGVCISRSLALSW